jgi:hypothetical protein
VSGGVGRGIGRAAAGAGVRRRHSFAPAWPGCAKGSMLVSRIVTRRKGIARNEGSEPSHRAPGIPGIPGTPGTPGTGIPGTPGIPSAGRDAAAGVGVLDGRPGGAASIRAKSRDTARQNSASDRCCAASQASIAAITDASASRLATAAACSCAGEDADDKG